MTGERTQTDLEEMSLEQMNSQIKDLERRRKRWERVGFYGSVGSAVLAVVLGTALPEVHSPNRTDEVDKYLSLKKSVEILEEKHYSVSVLEIPHEDTRNELKSRIDAARQEIREEKRQRIGELEETPEIQNYLAESKIYGGMIRQSSLYALGLMILGAIGGLTAYLKRARPLATERMSLQVERDAKYGVSNRYWGVASDENGESDEENQ